MKTRNPWQSRPDRLALVGGLLCALAYPAAAGAAPALEHRMAPAASGSAFEARLAAPLEGRTTVTLRRRGGEVQIVDGAGRVVDAGARASDRPVAIAGTPGNDTLRIDFGGGDPAPGGVSFDGGADRGGRGDELVIDGGSFHTVTSDLLPDAPDGSHRGTIDLDRDGRGGARATEIAYDGLEPVLINAGTVDNAVFNIPADAVDNQTVLEDDAIPDSSQLRSANGSFETTSFANPTGSLTINLGNDTTENITVNQLEAGFSAPITIDGGTGDNRLSFGDDATLNGGTFDAGTGTDELDYGAYTSSMFANLGLDVTGLSADLGGDQEVPAQDTTATGTATLTNYDPVAKTVDVAISVDGIAPAGVNGFHIHRAAPGVNGPIIVDFGTGGLVAAGTGFTFDATGVAIPSEHEAAFLGGQTYVNVHTNAASGGLIRGQLFSTGNAAANGTATGIGDVGGVENVTGGSVADSLVGSPSIINTLSGGDGADVLLGASGNDAFAGGDGGDTMVWSNGDGSDVMDGNGGDDRVQVNGSLGGATVNDSFIVGANGTRVDFDRASIGPFSLDIGTTETLGVSGVGGLDSVIVNDLTGVADLSSVQFHGLGGNDFVSLAPAVAGIAIDVRGGTGQDTLGGPGGTVAWSLDGPGEGTVAAAGATFERIENLGGGGGDDTFSFANGASVNGTVNGGLGTNVLDYGARTDAIHANLGLGVPATGLSADLDGAQEVPAQDSAATGTATFSNYDPVTKTFDVAVTVNGIAPADVTGFHIHRAAPGVNGPIIVDLGGGPLVPVPGGFTFTDTGVQLPPGDEAALLGGQTYMNVHTPAAPNGLIRGQVFSTGNINLASGIATGTGGVNDVQNLTGGSGADSLVGSFSVNTLAGGGGADVLVGGPGSDLLQGGDSGDTLVWSNGDGSDIMDGQGSSDRVQVNGSLGSGDNFTVAPGAGGRVDFDRTNLIMFSLDIGTTEALTVNGIGGGDGMFVSNLTGVTDLTGLQLNGLAGDDQLLVNAGPVPLTANGGQGGQDQTLAVMSGGVDTVDIGPAGGGRLSVQRTSPTPFALNAGGVELLDTALQAGNDVVTVNPLQAVGELTGMGVDGSTGDDTISVMPSPSVPLFVFGSLDNDRLRFDGGCAPVATDPGVLTAQGMQPVNHNDVENVDVASAVRLSSASHTVSEGAGATALDVVRDPSGTGNANVSFQTGDGSANSGLDFTGPGGALDLAPGELAKPLSVPITGDGADEPDETFTVSLTGAGPFAHLCDPTTATVTITDDDGPAAQTPAAGEQPAGRLRVLRATTGRDGSATLLLDVPGPGTVTGSAVATVPRASQRRRRTRRVVAARGRVRATRAGRVRFKLRPTRSGRSLLRKRRRLRTTATLTFRPVQGASLTSRRTLTLKLQPRRRRR